MGAQLEAIRSEHPVGDVQLWGEHRARHSSEEIYGKRTCSPSGKAQSVPSAGGGARSGPAERGWNPRSTRPARGLIAGCAPGGAESRLF